MDFATTPLVSQHRKTTGGGVAMNPTDHTVDPDGFYHGLSVTLRMDFGCSENEDGHIHLYDKNATEVHCFFSSAAFGGHIPRPPPPPPP